MEGIFNPKVIFEGLVTNAIWWFLGLALLALMVLVRRLLPFFQAFPEARRIRSQGVRRFLLSRNEYPERLDQYFDRAKESIKVISVSLSVTNDECNLLDLFRRKLVSDPHFEIHISLLSPTSTALSLVAESLDVRQSDLALEVDQMLSALVSMRDSLPAPERLRFHISTHASVPMGSVIMLDATPRSGVIQVETKLYKAPRVESFSFEITGGTAFFQRNYVAWNTILAESVRL